MRLTHRLACLLLILAPGRAVAAESPNVVASIRPIHAIAAAVMEGRGEPALLIEGAASPHAYQMRPADAARLEAADLVFWVGPALELFLTDALDALAAGKGLALMDAEGMRLLPNRVAGPFAAEDHDHDHDHSHDPLEMDSHVWLAPANGRAMARAMAGRLAALDPEGASLYAANAERLARRLDALEAEIAARLAPLRDRRFVVFHDATQYFEDAFGLEAAASLTLNPARQPGAKRVAEIRRLIAETGTACIFSEPQFPPRLLDVIAEGSEVKRGMLDVVGVELTPGPEHYPQLLLAMADAMQACLSE
ncbi:MAG: zinc ABC transporter substrate-binding protein [Alphaproteobacteria bacterium]|nr:zinc ABC transporter substrate-binding protein [Alphaproteobacteria bacterium]